MMFTRSVSSHDFCMNSCGKCQAWPFSSCLPVRTVPKRIWLPDCSLLSRRPGKLKQTIEMSATDLLVALAILSFWIKNKQAEEFKLLVINNCTTRADCLNMKNINKVQNFCVGGVCGFWRIKVWEMNWLIIFFSRANDRQCGPNRQCGPIRIRNRYRNKKSIYIECGAT